MAPKKVDTQLMSHIDRGRRGSTVQVQVLPLLCTGCEENQDAQGPGLCHRVRGSAAVWSESVHLRNLPSSCTEHKNKITVSQPCVQAHDLVSTPLGVTVAVLGVKCAPDMFAV